MDFVTGERRSGLILNFIHFSLIDANTDKADRQSNPFQDSRAESFPGVEGGKKMKETK